MKRFIAIIFLIISFPIILSGLSIEQGRMKLVLHEESGRFSLYYLDDIEENSYTSLLFERDPRTSSLGLLVNNKIVTLGTTKSYDQITEKTVDGARFVWVSPKLKIVESFRFVKSNPNGLTDGVAVTVKVSNVSEDIQSVGVHFLMDTYLGENRDSHFVTSNNAQIEGETGFDLQIPAYWISEAKDKSFKGFQSVVKGNGVTIPDKIVFSNWKRLSENLWNIQVQNNRNFNLLPYSINDSAACQFYNPIQLSPGGQRTVVMLLGAYTDAPLSLGNVLGDEPITRVSVEVPDIKAGDVEKLIKEDLIAVNDIISNIDSLLSFPDEISEEKIELIQRSLQTLQSKQAQYPSSQ